MQFWTDSSGGLYTEIYAGTRIDGCLAPFTFMNNDAEKILSEVRRDCEMIRESNTKGLNLMTAGSINNGSLLTSLRFIMQVIQNYGHY